MKMVHKNLIVNDVPVDLLGRAKHLETLGATQHAIAIYEKVISKNPLNEYAYNRLMIIYRKNKAYKKEKIVIDAGIRPLSNCICQL